MNQAPNRTGPPRRAALLARMPGVVGQFLRYGVIGGIAFIVDFSTLLALTELAHLHYLVAATVGFLVGLLVNYLLATRWVFDYRRLASRRVEFIVFGVVGIMGLALNNFSLYTLSGLLGMDYRIAKLLTAALVLLFNFTLRRALLFTPR